MSLNFLKRYTLALALLFRLLSLTSSGDTAPGDLDLSFGTAGKVNRLIRTHKDQAENVVVQPDGKIIVVGGSQVADYPDFTVVRFMPDGSLDSSFGTQGTVIFEDLYPRYRDSSATCVTLQSDGKIVAAGYYYNGDKLKIAVIRLTSDGAPDSTWGNAGRVLDPFLYESSEEVPHAVAVDSSGRIVLGGHNYGTYLFGQTVYKDWMFMAVRLTSTGAVDTTFNQNGNTPGKQLFEIGGGALNSSKDICNSLAIQADGKIVMGGCSGNAADGSSSRFALARLTDLGEFDTSFGNGGKVLTTFGGKFTNECRRVIVQSDGSILAAGSANGGGSGENGFALARYKTSGVLDRNFGVNGQVTTAFGGQEADGWDMAVQSDGNILVAGTATPLVADPVFGAPSSFALATYASTGQLNAGFGIGGKVVTVFTEENSVAHAVALQRDGRLVAAGTCRNDWYFALARYFTTASSITGFTPPNGFVGASVTITGTNLSTASAVSFSGTDASFAVNSATQITATVPPWAVSGPISVMTAAGMATSTSDFTVNYPAPTITSFTPAGASIGSTLTINGAGLQWTTAVTINGVTCDFFAYLNQLMVIVPAGASTGPVRVTTLGGTAASAANFTVNNGSSGFWSTTAWTGDTTSGVPPALQTDATGYWVGGHHFGASTNAVINGSIFSGISNLPTVNGSLLEATESAASTGASNNLTALGGTGSALLGGSSWYGNDPAVVILHNLVAGQTYRASFLSVGVAAGTRLVDFGSGTDHLTVDQDQFGAGNGIRVDYIFTATTPTQTINLDAVNSGATWNLHAIGLVRLVPHAPTVTVLAPTSITTTSAVLNATVNANGTTNFARFHYQEGNSAELIATGTPAPVSGWADTAVSATLTGLKPHTGYTVYMLAGSSYGFLSGFLTTANTTPTASSSTATTAEDTPVTFALTASDADGDTLSPSIVASPTHGTVTFKTGKPPTAIYTPAADYTGSDFFTYKVNDGYGGISITRSVSVTVTAVNDPPTITTIPDPAAINEDSGLQTVSFAGVTAGGGESQTLTVTATSSNPALIPNPTVTYTSPNATGTLTYSPVADANGTAVITVTVQDSGGTANGGNDTSTTSFNVTVTPVNDPPSFTLPVTQTPAGVNWTARDSARYWNAIASSADGTKLAAVVSNGRIYTSTDSGATWTARAGPSNRAWGSIASSADGTKLAAANNGGQIYTSTDSGVTWTARAGSGSRFWTGIVSSADGTKLAAVEDGNSTSGQIYTSTDSGVSWTAQAAAGTRRWGAIASSSDGTRLVAAVTGGSGGFLYTSTDSGVTWKSSANDAFRQWASVASSSDGTKLAAVASGGSDRSLYTSTDAGGYWKAQAGAGSRNWNSIASSADGTKLAAVVANGLIYTSVDSGVTWTAQAGAGSLNWSSIASSSDGLKLAAGVSNGQIYTSAGAPYGLSASSGAGPGMVAAFATNISSGPANESGQTVYFNLASDNNGLFTTQPAIAPGGTLTFTPKPAVTTGTVNVTVSAQDDGGTDNGGVDTSAAQTFTITLTPDTAAPTLTAISPASGSTLGGTTVTITGTHLAGVTAVSIGGTAMTGVSVVDATTITATIPAHGAGTFNVAATAASGSGTLTNGFTYIAPPTVTAVSPSVGSTLGGSSVTITGTNLTGATGVTIGGTAATGVNVVNGTTITATIPAHGAGTFNVAVTTAGGTGTGSGLFTFGVPPTASTLPATTVLTTAATLNGSVNANSLSTAVTFRYGLTTSYGGTATAAQSPVTGGTAAQVSAAVSGLQPHTLYHYQVSGTNTAGSQDGLDATFTTANSTPVAVAQSGVTTNEDTVRTITLAATDADGDALTFAVGTAPAHGSVSIAGNVATYTPAADYNGSDSFTFTASDGYSNGTSAAAMVSLTIMPVNDLPVFTKGPDRVHPAGTTGAQTVAGWATGISAGPGETQALTFNVSNNNPGLFTVVPALSANGTLTYTPNGTAGSATVTVTLTDDATAGGPALTTAAQSFTITLSGVAPLATTLAATAVSTTAATLNGTVNANFTSTAVTFKYGLSTSYGGTATAAQSPVTSGTATAVSAAVSGLQAHTLYHFLVSGTNAAGSIAGLDATFTTANSTPVAVAQSGVTTNEDTAKTITLAAADADGDGLTFVVGTAPAHGSVSIAGNVATYTPAADYNGSDSFTFTASDGYSNGTSAAATVSLTIVPVNDLPIFTKGPDRVHQAGTNSAQTVAGWATGISAGPGETQALTFNVSNNNPALFTAAPALSANGTLTYTPNGAAGSATVTVTLTDDATAGGPALTTAAQSFTITLSGVAPLATTLAATAISTTAATLNGSLTANFTSTAVTFSYGLSTSYGGTVTAAQSPVTGGSLTAVSAALTSLAPHTAYHYAVNATNAGGAVSGADLSFTTANSTPVATAQSGVATNANTPVAITLAGTDADADALTFAAATAPAHGSLSLAGNIATYTPALNYIGPDSFTFTAADAFGGTSAPATVSLNVAAGADFYVSTRGGAITVTNLTGTADTLNLSQSGTGIQFAASGRTFNVDVTGVVSGNTGVLSLSGIGSITVNAGGGADTINVGAFTVPLPNLSIYGGTESDTVTLAGNLTFAPDASLTVDLQADDLGTGADSLTVATNAKILTSGTGRIVARVSKNVLLNTGSVLETVDGGIWLEANQQAAASTGGFPGVNSSGTIRSLGAGPITITGTGGNGAASQHGVLVSGGTISGGTTGSVTLTGLGGANPTGSSHGVVVNANATVTSLGGTVLAAGTGSPTAASSFGIAVFAGSAVKAGSMGSVTLQGTGGAAIGGGNRGVTVSGAGAIVTSSGGDVSVTGYGAGLNATTSSPGVVVITTGTITAGGTGKVTVTGGGGPAAAAANQGVLVSGAGASITSAGGDVTVIGTGGGNGSGGSMNVGVNVVTGIISAGGLGNVSVSGTGGPGVSDASSGVALTTTGKITSAGGKVTVTGTCVSTGASATAYGLTLTNDTEVSATGAGTLTLRGTGASQSTSSGADGVHLFLTAGTTGPRLATAGGAIMIEGTPGASGTAFQAEAGSTITGGPVTILADQIALATGTNAVVVNAGSSTVTLQPRTAGQSIGLGATDTANRLGLTNAELNCLTASTVTIGSAASGLITISEVISPAGYQTLDLRRSTTFVAGSGLAADLSSASVFEKVKVTGTLAIDPAATLSLATLGGFVPGMNDAFTLIQNSSGSTTGSFSGLPSGTPFSIGGMYKWLSYAGGTGGDVTLLNAQQWWREKQFGPGANPADTADNADPDHDGVSNLLERAFGTNATGGGSGASMLNFNGTMAGGGTVAATGLPRPYSETTGGVTHRWALFVRVDDYAVQGLTYTVEFSPDLSLWQASVDVPTVLADDGAAQIVGVPWPATIGGQEVRFFRVRVGAP